MASKLYIDNITPVDAASLNDFNNHVYNSTPISPATTVHPASVLANAPTGLIIETTVQGALNGLESRKAKLGGDTTISFSALAATTPGQVVTLGQVRAASYNTAQDTGVVNAYSATYSPAITAYTPGMLLNLESILVTNTGASTFNGGAGVIPITSAFGALQGGELFIGKGAILRINAAGTGAELIQTTGGSMPVKAATNSGQAVNLGQAQAAFAALTGNAGQSFNVAGASVTSEAVNLGQLNAVVVVPGSVYTTPGYVFGVVYTNSKTRTVTEVVSFTQVSSGSMNVYVGGAIIASAVPFQVGDRPILTFSVPPGATFEIISSMTLTSWSEL